MLPDLIIACEDDDLRLPLTADALVAAAHRRWPGGVRVVDGRTESVVLHLDVVAEGPGFSIGVLRGLGGLTVDGTPEQNRDAAVWLRTLLPADGPRVVAFDSGLTAEVEQVPGMTADDFDAAVRRAWEGAGA